ncbi:MAG: serine hydrolase domain-containing protein [Saprospiraceae bacterium]
MIVKRVYSWVVSFGLFGCFTLFPIETMFHPPLYGNQNITKDPVSEEYKIKIASLSSQFETQVKQKMSQAACVGMSFGAIHKGEIVFMEHFGSKFKGSSESIQDTTVFRIGSVSKGFAGILASKLIQEGKFTLDDPINKYIPELKIKTKSVLDTITVRDVLSHTTGYIQHAFSNLVDDNISMDRIIQAMNRYPLKDRVGKVYNYQNAAFALIEKVIENTTGLKYEEALKKHIFQPLAMNHSSASYASMMECTDNCVGHKPGGKKGQFVSVPIKPHYYNAASAGGVNSSISDMLIWLKALMGYKPEVINDEVRLRAFTPYIYTTHAPKYFNRWDNIEESAYGLGWRVLRFDDKVLIYHGGLVNGFRAEIAFEPGSDWGMVALFNSTCSFCNSIVPTFFQTKDQIFASVDNP